MKIVFDLDGVIRDLSGWIAQDRGCSYPNCWDYDYAGKTIYECVEEKLEYLEQAHPTAYKSVIKGHLEYPEIWTHQPEGWRSRTMKWVNKHIGAGCVVLFMDGEEKVERAKKENAVLVEDSPKLSSYENILLIDRPYNQEVQGVMRIYGSKHLGNMIEFIKRQGENG